MSASEIKLHFEQWGKVARVYLHVVTKPVLKVHEEHKDLVPHLTDYMTYDKDTLPSHLKKKWKLSRERLMQLERREYAMIEAIGHGHHSPAPFAFVTFVHEDAARACVKAYAESRRSLKTRMIIFWINSVAFMSAVLLYPIKKLENILWGSNGACECKDVELSEASSSPSRAYSDDPINQQVSTEIDIESQKSILARPGTRDLNTRKELGGRSATEASVASSGSVMSTKSFERRKKITLAMRSNRVDLTVSRSPEPDDIIWQNLEHIGYERFFRYAWTGFVFISCMAFFSAIMVYTKVYSFCLESAVDTAKCFSYMTTNASTIPGHPGDGCVPESNEEKMSFLYSLLLTVCLSSIRWIITQTVIPWIVSSLKCHTIASEERRLFAYTITFEIIVLIWINGQLSQVMVKTYENLCYTSPEAKLKTFADQGAFLCYLFFSDCLVMIFVKVFQPYERIYREIRLLYADTQSELNTSYTPPRFSIGKQYAMLAKVIVITLVCTARYPLLFVVAAFHVMCQLLVDKYCLLNNTRIKGNIGNDVGVLFLVMMPMSAFYPAWPELFSQGEYSVWSPFTNSTAVVQPYANSYRMWAFVGVTTTGTLWFLMLYLGTRSRVRRWFKSNGCSGFLKWCTSFESLLKQSDIDDDAISRTESRDTITGALAGVLNVFTSREPSGLPWSSNRSNDFRIVEESEDADDDRMTYWTALEEEFRSKVAFAPSTFHPRHLYEGSGPKTRFVSALQKQMSEQLNASNLTPTATALLTAKVSVRTCGLKAWTGALVSNILQGDRSLKWIPKKASLYLDRLVLETINTVPKQVEVVNFTSAFKVSKIGKVFKSTKVKTGFRPFTFVLHKQRDAAQQGSQVAGDHDVVAICSAGSATQVNVWISAIEFCVHKLHDKRYSGGFDCKK